jgi:hypothetical protein
MDAREEGQKKSADAVDEEQFCDKKRKKNREIERQRKRRKKRMRKEKAVEEKCNPIEVHIRGIPTFLSVTTMMGFLAKAHYFPGLLDIHTLRRLHDLLKKEERFWKFRKDSRRMASDDGRKYFIAGRWAAVGHSREGVDSAHWAKPGGDVSLLNPELLLLLKEFWEIASILVEKYRPEMHEMLRKFSFSDVFGLFHIFFAVGGAAKLHRDPNDFLCFVFPIEMESNSRGGLEIGGTSICFQAKVGDATLLDSDVLQHGVREYQGDPNERLVGIFSIQKSYLRLKGVQFQ